MAAKKKTVKKTDETTGAVVETVVEVIEFGVLSQQFIDEMAAILQVVEAQALAEKDPKGKDLRPLTDPAGKAVATADALKLQFATDMRQYTSLKVKAKDTDGYKIREAANEARTALVKAIAKIRSAMQLSREAVQTREAQLTLWMKNNQGKIDDQISKADDQISKAQARKQTLEAQRAAAQQRLAS